MNSIYRAILLLTLAALITAPLAGCVQATPNSQVTPTESQGGESLNTPETTPRQDAGVDFLASSQSRQLEPTATTEDVSSVAQMNNSFAMDLYRKLSAKDGNLFFSPYSISMALAMTYAGARGETEKQMSETMRFILPQDQLHPALNALDLALVGNPEDQSKDEADTFKLKVANALWGQKSIQFLESFLDTLSQNYGAGMRVLDFSADPEKARQTINDWVAQQTEDKIQDLLPSGVVNSSTRFVLTNAIYFKAQWLHQFEQTTTKDEPFYKLDGSQISVPMMSQTAQFGLSKGDLYTAVELPYRGRDMSMVIFLPNEGKFADFEKYFSLEIAAKGMAQLKPRSVELHMPKFTYTAETDLSQTLSDMGMPKAFNPGADFSGMTGSPDFYIGAVLHKAFVAVDEEGTEAAAATGVIGLTSAMVPDATLTIDHPFVFIIRDKATGAYLFIGRVLVPEQ